MILTGKTKVLGENTVSVLLCPPQCSLHTVSSLPHKRIYINFPVFRLLIKLPTYIDKNYAHYSGYNTFYYTVL
jgi:hypothetical protein